MPHQSVAHLLSRLNNAKTLVNIGKLYYHYRTPDVYYLVLDIVINESDEQPAIVYQAQYGDNITWIRSVDKWLDYVEHNNKTVKRFTEKC